LFISAGKKKKKTKKSTTSDVPAESNDIEITSAAVEEDELVEEETKCQFCTVIYQSILQLVLLLILCIHITLL